MIPGAGQGIGVFDAKTLALTSSFAVAGADPMIVSSDSKTLYVSEDLGVFFAYDIATGAQLGWMPNVAVPYHSGGSEMGPFYGPNFQAISSAGLLAGPMEEGVGFLDPSMLRTGPVGSRFYNDYPAPATGPATGGTVVQLGETLVNPVTLEAVYVGGKPATSVGQGYAAFYATTPAGSPGPADIYATMADGGMLIVPEGFSYGPTILEVTPNSASADGGGMGVVFGYGLGSPASNAPVPTDLQITVDGKPAAVTGYDGNVYGILSPPFLLEAIAYAIPPGTASKSGDVKVTTSSGTATASGAMQYLPVLQQFPLQGAALAQGVYDARRDRYYFTDASQIRVFSRSSGQWLSPIQVPAAPTGMAHRLWGIAISPNGSKLAVSDQDAAVIYYLDPDSPQSIQTFSTPNHFPWITQNITASPAGLAVSDTGTIYFTAFTSGDSVSGTSSSSRQTPAPSKTSA